MPARFFIVLRNRIPEAHPPRRVQNTVLPFALPILSTAKENAAGIGNQIHIKKECLL